MNLTKRIVTATLAVAATLGFMPATSAAQARTSVSINYTGIGYRDGYRDRGDYRRDWRNDRRDWNRGRDYRYDNRRYGWNGGYGYRGARCWTDWRYDRWSNRRVPVRICR